MLWSVFRAECSGYFPDDDCFSDGLFGVVVGRLYVCDFDAGEPAFDVEVDIFGDWCAVFVF